MRHPLARVLTGLGILFATVAAWGPRHAAAPWVAPPSRMAGPPRTPPAAPVTTVRPPQPAPSTVPPTGDGPAPAPSTPPRRTKRSVPPYLKPLPPIGPHALLRRALHAVESAPAFHGTLAERVGRALPAVEKIIGADGSLMAPGRHILSIWHDRPDLWRIAARSAAHAPVDRLTVADGRTVARWTRQGDTYTIVRQGPGSAGPPGLGGLDTLLAQLKRGAQLRVAAQGHVVGRATYRLHAVQRVAGLAADTVDLWIDGRTYLPLRIVATGPAGIPLVSAGFSRIAFGDSPAARFRFVPPAGARRTGAAAAGGSGPAAKR